MFVPRESLSGESEPSVAVLKCPGCHISPLPSPPLCQLLSLAICFLLKRMSVVCKAKNNFYCFLISVWFGYEDLTLENKEAALERDMAWAFKGRVNEILWLQGLQWLPMPLAWSWNPQPGMWYLHKLILLFPDWHIVGTQCNWMNRNDYYK